MRGYAILVVCCAVLFSQNSNTYRHDIEKAGDIIQIALPLAAVAATLFEKSGSESDCFVSSFATNLLITHAAKLLIRKQRPNGVNEYNAMPSGHTSASFHAAAFIQMHYGWEYGAPAYALASFVGYSRIEGKNERHDIWDVLAGAALGIATSYYFYKDDAKALKVESDFVANGIRVSYSF